VKKAILVATIFTMLAFLAASCQGLVPTPPVTAEPIAPGSETPSSTSEPTIPSESTLESVTEFGNFRFLISDEVNAIGDFDSLLVTITEIGVHKVGGESSGWLDLPLTDLDPRDVELTNLVGDPAVVIWSGTIPVGQYTKVFIHVDTITNVLKVGGTADVMLPSDKLQISKPFVVTEDNDENNLVNFVYDVTVKKAGGSGKYLILPQIGKSGADQPFAEVDMEAPTVLSITTLDRDADGKVDAATVVFSEAVDDSTFTATPGDWTIGGATVEAIDSLTTADDDTFQLQITLDGGNEIAGTEAKDVVYAPGTGADLAGNALAAIASGDVTEIDGASPHLLSIAYTDVDDSTTVNVGDTLDFEFSEAMDQSTITDSNIDTVLPITGTGTTYGTTPTLSWNIDSTILTVTLGAGVDVVTGDTVNPTDPVTDIEGNADATAGNGPAIA